MRIRLAATVLGVLVLASLIPARPSRALGSRGRASGVVGAQADHVFEPLRTPNDPRFALNQGYLRAVHAPEAWDVQMGDPGIVVAVLDSGIDIGHPDLAANIWNNPNAGAADCGQDVHGCNYVDPAVAAPCGTGSALHTPDVSPLTSHGTFIAGIIGARGNNGLGISGIAWSTSLMAVRVAGCRGASDTVTLVNGIHYAVDRGARVIDIGVGTSRSSGAGCRPPNQFVADAVQYARDHGTLVVAGTGNAGTGCVDDPAATPGVLAVGGLQLPDGGRWHTGRYGSNWGPEVAVAAPANDLISTVPRRAGQTSPDDLYELASGTAFAAPIVAGEAVLLLSQNPLLTPDWLIQLIELGAHAQPDTNAPNWAGAGEVDLAASLQLVPAGYAGLVTQGGAPASPGATVEAFVGGVLCAQAATFTTPATASSASTANGGQTSYLLLVPAAAMQSGCGVAGATVDISVDGVAAAQIPWAPSSQTLDLAIPSPAAGLTRAPLDRGRETVEER